MSGSFIVTLALKAGSEERFRASFDVGQHPWNTGRVSQGKSFRGEGLGVSGQY